MTINGDVNFQGDWLGFTYNGVHSSTYNIVRTSSGSNRFEKDLLPPQEERKASIVGKDGQYFFKSNYQPMNIKISFAYDNLTETQIRAMRQWLGDKNQHNLIMDEEPYKQYFVKVTGTPKLSYIAFDNADKTKRIYKGEGDIEFIAYEPFAKHVHKTIDSYATATITTWAGCTTTQINYTDLTPIDAQLKVGNSIFVPGYGTSIIRELGVNSIIIAPALSSAPPSDIDIKIFTSQFIQWKEVSGLLTEAELTTGYDIFDLTTGIANIYNPGDMESPFIITDFIVLDNTPGTYQTFNHLIDGNIVNQIVLDMGQLTQNAHYRLDSKLRLLVGYTNGVIDNSKVYNNAIIAGDFFNLKTRNSLFDSSAEKAQTVVASPAPGGSNCITIIKQNNLDITYDYLYY